MTKDTVEKFQETLKEGVQRYYSEQLSVNIKRAIGHRVKNGIWCWRPPYGYKKKDGNIVIDKSQARTVKKIYRLKSKGLSITEIQYKTRRAKLSASRVRAILKNPFYLGYINYKGFYYAHNYEKLI